MYEIKFSLSLTSTSDRFTDVRLRKFASEKKELQDEIRHLRLELEETRSRVRSERSSGSVLGGYLRVLFNQMALPT